MVMNSRETGQSFSGDLFKSLHRGARPPGTGPNDTTTFVPNAVVQPVGSDIAGFPVYHHIPGLGGPDEGPWSDRCCETSDKCCCGFFHDCWYPAHHCCRCPPWFLVVAFVLTCVSFLVNFGVLTPFFRAFVSVYLTPDAAVAECEALNLQPWSSNTYRVAEVVFNGFAIEAFTALETHNADTRDKIRGSAHETLVFGTYSEGRDKSDEIRGSAHWTATEIDELSCERITAFYKDGKPVYEDEDSGSGRDIANETDPYQSAVDLRYYGMWPSDSAVDAVVRNCEGVKKRMKSAGGAEIVIRAATFPLGFVLVTAFGILVGRCSACCRRNACHSSLPTIGRLSLYLLAFILCVDLACLALYARTFPDMDDEKVGVTLNSIVFALILPVLIQEHVIVAVGDIDLWEVDRGGFGCAVFAWGLHMFAILLVARAVKSGNNTREFDGLGAPRRKGWGRWYRPERENDAMPPDVATAAPRALQMPSVAEHFKTGVAGSIPDEDDDASTDVSISDVSEVSDVSDVSEGSEGSDVSGVSGVSTPSVTDSDEEDVERAVEKKGSDVSGVSTPSVTDSDEEDVERAEKKEEVEEKKEKKKFLGLF